MIQDICVLALSLIYYGLEYFNLQLHISQSPMIFVISLVIDFSFFVYVVVRFFEKQINQVSLALLLLPFFWIVKTSLMKIQALSYFSAIPDWTILLLVATPYFYYLINMVGGSSLKGKRNVTDRKKSGKESDDLGDYPIWITPDLALPTHDRFLHTQLIGSTGSGKTWLVIKPWIYQDIRHGAGTFIFDIKSNMKEDILKMVTDNKANRDLDFYCFSLGDKSSHSYNPLAGDNPGEIANRVASALYFAKTGEPFYEDSQKIFLTAAIHVLHKQYGTITFEHVYKATTNPVLVFKSMCPKYADAGDMNAKYLLEKIKDPDLTKILTGLVNRLGKFVLSPWASQINTTNPDINVADIVVNNKILLWQANSGQFSQDYKPLSILMMMHLQAEISKRYAVKPEKPFFIYLDEFYNILYPDFPELINKAREAKVGLIFGHQALGDLELYGQNVKNIILTNSRNKIILNIEDPVTAEYYSKAWGTDTVEKRQSSYSTKDGEREAGFSIKEEEAFVIHPNEFKYLKLKEGYVKLETKQGKIIRKVEFVPIDFNKIKTHKLHLRHKPKVKVEEPMKDIFPEEKPTVSLKGKFSMKNAAADAPATLKDALKKDIPDEKGANE